jgi:aminoglycoside 3-N-acetyltransferase
MISYRDLVQGFRQAGVTANRRLIVHAALSSFGDEIRGGSESVLGALLSVSGGVMAPTFTDKPMLIPEEGPPDNAIIYGSGRDSNKMAEFFTPEMPADPTMGTLPEAIRRHPESLRSLHPLLSFAGVSVDSAIDAQTIIEPLTPIGELTRLGGAVLLIGVDHTVNTSIHYAEALVGRKQFVRWALTPRGVRECPGYPGCSEGFAQANGFLDAITTRAQVGQAVLRLIPLEPMIAVLVGLMREQPTALLCSHDDCERCNAVRQSVSEEKI